ncbi:MAG: sulfide/dihydroorotate dehydrogenase-like FAD/NAD-binding protein [Acidimicrobiia bacterium]|nr:sulfide/dihydroorotate dehydrogenase-like FAD/NAD-binding protein [Acidimicrobiia bacterium]
MNRILETRLLAPDVKYFRVEAPKVARKRRAGQFVIVRVAEDGERIPLTIADSGEGWIALIVQAVGKTTTLLNRLDTGDNILDLAGPLGVPSEIDHFGTVVVVGGGVGTAIAYPSAVALKEAGNRVISIIGGRSHSYVILEDELDEASDEVHPCTDDGSYGFAGLVTDKLQEIISSERVDRVLAIGPIPMMAAVAEMTRPLAIPTIVSLNPIMVDGTGMCGGCRVRVGGESRFACVDGPEFDAHEVDFELLATRNTAYAAWEHFRRIECASP